MARLTLIIVVLFVVSSPQTVRGDAFDYYLNPVLVKVPDAPGVMKLQQLTPELMVRHSRVLPMIQSTLVVVRTGEGRMSKLLVQAARQKVSDAVSLPIVLIERFVTYREGEEQTIHAKGENIRLFADFHLSLDIGQVVPASLGGDLKLVVKGENVSLEPAGKAEMFLVTKPIPGVTPAKAPKVVIGAAFEPRFFTGIYKLYDDGRRSATLHLSAMDTGEVEGWYYSAKDGQKYEVIGKAGNPNHAIQFKVTFPRSIQFFHGFMFTGDGRAITGSSKLEERETGFYALRVED